MSSKIGRRQLFKHFGSQYALMYALLNSNPLLNSNLLANTTNGSKKRVIFIFSPFGMRPKDFHDFANKGKDLKFSEALNPLNDPEIKDQLTYFHGLSYKNSGVGDPHQQGTGKFLTGLDLAIGNFRTGPGDASNVGFGGAKSLDHVLGDLLHPDIYRKVMYLGLYNEWSKHPNNTVSLIGPNQPDEPLLSSKAAFDVLFGRRNTDVDINAYRTSVLDSLIKSINEYKAKQPKSVQKGLEMHLDGIRDIEKSLQKQAESCEPAKLNISTKEFKPKAYDQVMQDYINLISVGFGCDLNRVVTLNFYGCRGGPTLGNLGIARSLHSMSHLTNATGMDEAVRYRQSMSQFIRDLMVKLKNTPELDNSGSLLDNTIILWGSDSTWVNRYKEGKVSGISGHRLGDLPFIVGGGKNLLNTGIQYNFKDRFHNDLLVTIAKALGTNLNSIGAKDLNKGVLSGVLKNG